MCYTRGPPGGPGKEPIMENIEVKIEGDTLTIKVDLSVDLGLSKSQKSRNIATTRGSVNIPGTDAIMGLNIYRKV